jgi:ABC-2 type transport system permease protein
VKLRLQENIQYLIGIGILLALTALGRFTFIQWDLTEEHRYTLTKPTSELLANLDNPVYVRVLLEGDFPAGFKRLQRATQEMLDAFRKKNPLIQYVFDDPGAGDMETQNARIEELAKDGIIPTRLRIRESGEATEKLIYPYAVFQYGVKSFVVNLLENERPGVDNEWILNNSVTLLEYKFANAIQKLQKTRRSNVVFLSGHDELVSQQTAWLEKELQHTYNTARVDLDTVIQIPEEINLIVIARPHSEFSTHEQFLIDQYLVNGGNAIFLIDALNVSLDSINQSKEFIPSPYALNLDPLFFRMGLRMEPNLILDLECTRIPLVVGNLGGRPQTELFPWYYHPLISPSSDHPIVKDMDRVNLMFPSTIDTIQSPAGLHKTILLASSVHSRIQRVPVRLNFEILRYKPETELFNNGNQPVAVLVEGRYSSMFENRVTEELLALTRQVNVEYRVTNKDCKVLVVSDGDLAKNLYNSETGDIRELGYNKFENFVFQGNQTFLINAIEYMLDDDGILAARSKEIKLRMLDTARATDDAMFWRILNIGVPVLLVILGSLLFNMIRKRKYGVQKVGK